MRWLSIFLLTLIAGCSMMEVGPYPRTSVPVAIAAPQNQKLSLVAAAEGVVIYRCDPVKDAPGRFDWAYQSAEATLRDVSGRHIGRYHSGTTWEAVDGSKVTGIVQASIEAPDKGGLPWLRLDAKSAGGAGLLASVTGIQRMSTMGGRQPAAGCEAPDQGRIVRVPYGADYNFYVSR